MLNRYDDIGIYAGSDIEIVLRRGLMGLNRVLAINRDYEKYYLKMLSVAPDSKVALEGLVKIYAQMGQFDQATMWYRKLGEKYLTDYTAGCDLGWRLMRGDSMIAPHKFFKVYSL